MKNRYLWGIVIFSILCVSIFVGLSDTPDSFGYIALGKYLYSGKPVPISPFNLDRPQTLFGPVYALLVTPIYRLPAPVTSTLVTALQLLLLVGSSLLMYKTAKRIFGHPWPIVTAILFLLLPFNILYGTFMMSETVAQFCIALFLFTLSGYKTRPHEETFSLLTLYGALATLTRFGYVILFAGSLAGWMYTFFKGKKSKNIPGWLPVILGCACVLLWILFNYNVNGTWTLSSYTGHHVYDSVVYDGKLLPDARDPSLLPFTKNKYTPADLLNKPWWEAQIVLIGTAANERDADRMFLALSVAAIRAHPLEYAAQVVGRMIRIPVARPYLRDTLRTNFAACHLQPADACRPSYDNNLTCFTPAVQNCTAQSAWSSFIRMNELLYPWGMAVLLTLVFTGSVLAFFSKQVVLGRISVLFLVLLGFHAATELVEGRFLIPLYPLYVLLLIYPLTLIGAKKIQQQL